MEVVKKKGFIVMTGDKGMAGAYNHNVVKEAENLLADAESYRLFVVGEVGRSYLYNQGYQVEKDFRFSTNNPSIHRARVMTEQIIELYKQEELDEVYVIYTRMVNSMKEEVEIEQLLPLKTHEFIKQEKLEQAEMQQASHEQDFDDENEEQMFDDGEYIIYPSPKKLLKSLVYNYVTGFLYGALVEASASEENARMMAMQSATDNAQDMLRELSIEYNRVRQSAITQEITEVIGGAKALKNKKKKQVR
jgi:F-type H+-transporting ATPase subunit gamma